MDVAARIKTERIIAILRGLPEAEALNVIGALRDGGIRMVELTFDQRAEASATASILRKACERFGGEMCFGAGTVMTREQLTAAKKAGARFILSPNTDAALIRLTRELGLVSIPGAYTPTEIALCFASGADIVKVFPADALGPSFFKAVRGPMPHIPLSAVGGVHLGNIGDFFAAGVCCVGIGSGIVDMAAVRTGDYGKIADLARAYLQGAGKSL